MSLEFMSRYLLTRPLLLILLVVGCKTQDAKKNCVPPQPPTSTVVTDLLGMNSCEVRSGRVLCKGGNGWGQLGLGKLTPDAKHFTEIPEIVDAVQVVVGLSHSCMLHRSGKVSCWGSKMTWPLGVGFNKEKLAELPVTHPEWLVLSPTVVPNLDDVVELGAGNYFTCARKGDGSVQCWGITNFDFAPARTHGLTVVPHLPASVRLYVGGRYACSLTNGGDIFCWGRVLNGGGDFLDNARPAKVFHVDSPEQAVSRPLGMCVRRCNETPRCWGRFSAQ